MCLLHLGCNSPGLLRSLLYKTALSDFSLEAFASYYLPFCIFGIFHHSVNSHWKKWKKGVQVFLIVLNSYNFSVLERVNISSDSSIIELDNFEFEHILRSRIRNFLRLILSLQMSLFCFNSNILIISSFIKYKFLKNTNSNFI